MSWFKLFSKWRAEAQAQKQLRDELRNVPSGTGYKDKGIPGVEKVRMELLPPKALLEIARVYTDGAARVGARNWEKGIPYGDCYAATQRHLQAFWAGEGPDPKHGTHHLAHAAFWILALLHFEQHAAEYAKFDDRPGVGL